jgi:phenylalanyl-tRNA synthetase beta chain
LYRGIGVETGRKSVALGLIFQDKNSTLTEEVIEGEMAAIRAALTLRLGASFRE